MLRSILANWRSGFGPMLCKIIHHRGTEDAEGSFTRGTHDIAEAMIGPRVVVQTISAGSPSSEYEDSKGLRYLCVLPPSVVN
jgi:hypothetical protein